MRARLRGEVAISAASWLAAAAARRAAAGAALAAGREVGARKSAKEASRRHCMGRQGGARRQGAGWVSWGQWLLA